MVLNSTRIHLIQIKK